MRRLTELSNLKLFHPKRFDHAISAHGFLKNLTEFTQSRLAILHGAADLLSQLSYRPQHQRQKHRRAQRHDPIEAKKHGNEYDQRETLTEEVGKVFRNGEPSALHVVDYHRHQAAGRLVLEEPDGLADKLGVNFIAQIGHRAMTNRLNERVTQELGS